MWVGTGWILPLSLPRILGWSLGAWEADWAFRKDPMPGR